MCLILSLKAINYIFNINSLIIKVKHSAHVPVISLKAALLKGVKV